MNDRFLFRLTSLTDLKINFLTAEVIFITGFFSHTPSLYIFELQIPQIELITNKQQLIYYENQFNQQIEQDLQQEKQFDILEIPQTRITFQDNYSIDFQQSQPLTIIKLPFEYIFEQNQINDTEFTQYIKQYMQNQQNFKDCPHFLVQQNQDDKDIFLKCGKCQNGCIKCDQSIQFCQQCVDSNTDSKCNCKHGYYAKQDIQQNNEDELKIQTNQSSNFFDLIN
ncbi:hypothetical protein PPERSA_07583 [Pseudocohnilembus persalinus]|uniref:Uncharacterized protein n=1 Tax=Pseudocohnilembus persalinus TaxID=266149 RepID=A0A0V0QZW7_PSEPJ|nr:hypothetical protein PPERSA_07583 [Pseudocohnilembus persalinus]|eukprot:KRX07833.1 hypothetical protein PPERSA_07583 [Pseudocohnilembus persalinus]